MFSWNIYNIFLLNYFEKKYKKNEDLKLTKIKNKKNISFNTYKLS